MSLIDRAIVQFISAAVIVAAASQQSIVTFLSGIFPFGEIALPAVVFVILYRLLLKVYEAALWPYIHRRRYLGGQWIYQLHNHTTGKKLYGVFEIEHRIDGVRVKEGSVWFCGKRPFPDNQRGVWESLAASLDDRSLTIIFQMKTLAQLNQAGAGTYYSGTMIFSIISDHGTPIRLEGLFVDHGERAGMQGAVFAKKVEAESRLKLEECAFSDFGGEQI